jgi:hypothetical protein
MPKTASVDFWKSKSLRSKSFENHFAIKLFCHGLFYPNEFFCGSSNSVGDHFFSILLAAR